MTVMWKNEKGNTCYGVNPATKERKPKSKPKPKQEPKKEPEKEPETVEETEEKEG